MRNVYKEYGELTGDYQSVRDAFPFVPEDYSADLPKMTARRGAMSVADGKGRN